MLTGEYTDAEPSVYESDDANAITSALQQLADNEATVHVIRICKAKGSNKSPQASAYLLIPDGVPHVEGIIFQGVLGVYPLLVSLILALVLLSLLDHALNLVLTQAALVIGDGDLVLCACIRLKQ